MARKKYIDNQELLLLFEHYLLEHCSNNPRLFKIPQFGNYLRSNGFPQVADTTIRRNKEFRQPLNDRLELFEDDTYQTVITYKIATSISKPTVGLCCADAVAYRISCSAFDHDSTDMKC